MEIQIWKSDWGLASVDLDCLRTMAYGKFIGLPVKVVETNNPFFSPSGTLPIFKDGKKIFTKFVDIVEHLKTQNHNVDTFLSTKEQSEVFAFSQYLKEKLFPAIQYIWWVDNKNYTEVTRLWYAKALPFPLNFYYPGQYQRNAQDMIDALYGENADKQHIENQIYTEAEKCITALSERLGDSEFYFGNRPSSLDAAVFAYLAPISKAPLKNSRLQNHIMRYANLSRFIIRICQRYFAGISSEYSKEAKNHKKMKAEYESDPNIANFPNKTRNKIFASLFAIVAMTGYALANGLLQLNFKDDYDSIQEYNQLFEGDEDESN